MRISFKDYCGKCRRPFELFETVNYCPDDNDSFCTDCKQTIRYHSWVPSLYIGEVAEDASKNLKGLIQSFNERLDEYEKGYEIMIKG